MRQRTFLGIALPVVLGLAAMACSSGDPDLPDTTGAAPWSFLDEVDYTENWELWPGKGEKYQGGEPHGALFTTYLNPVALEALTSKAGAMPNSAIIVKENYMAEGTFDLITLMYKVRGFNPDSNDWFWAKLGSDGEVQAEGKVEGCQACHGTRKDNDFVLTESLK